MIQIFVNGIVQLLKATNMSNWLIVVMISFLPFSESRLGIPIGIRLGLSHFQSFVFAFVGSSLAIPCVLIFCVPLIDKLANSRRLSKIANFFRGDLQDKANKLTASKPLTKRTITKKMLAVSIFVALPGPLTGVWAGSAVASLLRLNFACSLISVVVGNLIASLLVLIFSDIFAQYIDLVIFALLALTVLAVLAMLFRMVKKLFTKKPAV
jgi:uncharacterized membrane protein